MLAVILWILKIIGVILLVLAGLAVLLILTVLLSPVCYRAEGSWYGEPKASASVSWLFHIISLRAEYGERRQAVLRIFGIPVGAERGEKEKTKKRKKSKTSSDQPEKTPAREQNLSPKPSGPEGINEPGDAGRPEAVRGSEDKTDSRAAGKRILRIPKLAARGRAGLSRARRRLAGLLEKKERLIAFFQDETNQKTLKLLKRQIFALLRHVLPRKIRGKVRFGFDDPYTTGQVLMYAAPFYGLYAKSLELIPVFEEPVLEGELYLRGKIRIGTVLVLAGRMMLDRNFRSLLKKWREG